MQGTFPIDIWSVKQFGIENWYNQCSRWPVSDVEFLTLSKKIEDMFEEIVLETKDEIIQDALIVLYRLTLEYSMFINALIVINRLREKKYEIYSLRGHCWK